MADIQTDRSAGAGAIVCIVLLPPCMLGPSVPMSPLPVAAGGCDRMGSPTADALPPCKYKSPHGRAWNTPGYGCTNPQHSQSQLATIWSASVWLCWPLVIFIQAWVIPCVPSLCIVYPACTLKFGYARIPIWSGPGNHTYSRFVSSFHCPGCLPKSSQCAVNGCILILL